MSKLSISLQAKSLDEMTLRRPYMKKLAGFEYLVMPRVFKGSTDTELFCKVLPVRRGCDVWDIGTGTGLVALTAKKKGAKYVLATDFNIDAVKNSKANSKLLKLKLDVKHADLFGNIKKKFDIISFNPPFTNLKTKEKHHISFWDEDHKTVKRFFAGIQKYLKPSGRAFIAWASFADTRVLKRIAKDLGYSLKEIGKKKGKMGFIYYIFEICRK